MRTDRTFHAFVVLVGFFGAACGDSGGPGGSGGAATGGANQGGQAPVGGSNGEGGAGTGGGPVVDCSSGVFPTFGKTCVADTDCAIAFHQTSCCGTRSAIGI